MTPSLQYQSLSDYFHFYGQRYQTDPTPHLKDLNTIKKAKALYSFTVLPLHTNIVHSSHTHTHMTNSFNSKANISSHFFPSPPCPFLYSFPPPAFSCQNPRFHFKTGVVIIAVVFSHDPGPVSFLDISVCSSVRF